MISVRRTNGLPQASFRFHLTMDTLALLTMCFPLTGALRTFTFKNNVRAGRTEELTTKVASFQQRTKPLWIGLRPSLSDFLLHLPGALPFGRVLPRLSDMHPCDASPTAVQAL